MQIFNDYDVIALQETKLSDHDILSVQVNGFTFFIAIEQSIKANPVELVFI
jgi:exonuclease III